jgi:hypothetical protein
MSNPIKDSGSRTIFDTGANRDCKDENGRTDLMPTAVCARLINLAPTTNLATAKSKILKDKFLMYADDFIYTGNTEALILAMYEFIMQSDVFVEEYIKVAEKLECEPTLETVTAKQLVTASLLPLSMHFKNGTLKYGERNWEKGMPLHSYIDSACRHYLKMNAGFMDEPHHLAVLWNLMCAVWTIERKPEMNDLPFAKKNELESEFK